MSSKKISTQSLLLLDDSHFISIYNPSVNRAIKVSI